MSVPVTTVQVAISLWQITGQPLPNARVQFGLTKADVQTGSGLVLPAPIDLFVDANGTGVATLFANVDGLQGTQTSVAVYSATGQLQYSGYASIPAFNCNLHDVLNLTTPSVTDAQTAVNTARDWALRTGSDVPEGVAGDRSSKSWAQEDLTPSGQNRGGSSKDWAISSTLPDGVNPSAKTSAAAATATALQTAADRVQTGADRVQTDADVMAANAAQAQSNSNMLTAIAQASLASIYALSAASVAQQDLSGVTAAALHRSPNAVVGMCIDDPRTHSDGGAWTSKVDHLSWMNETLQGAWLTNNDSRGLPTELDARCAVATTSAELSLGTGTPAVNTTISADGTVTMLPGGPNTFTTINLSGAVSTTALYRVTATVTKVGGVGAYIRLGSNVSTAVQCNAVGTFTFVIQGGGTSAFLYTGPYGGATDSATIKFSVKQITGAFAPSGSYYQSATDGKFYRLWKNLFQWSEQFDNAAWTKTGVTVTANAVAEPLAGTLTADKLVSSGGAGQQRVDAGVIPANGTISVYAKAGEANWLWIGSAQFGNEQAWFDLTNGVVGTKGSSLASSSITSLGGGWYRCQATLAAGATQGFGSIGVSGADNSVVGPVAGNGLYVWGAQLEYGTSATTYEQKVADGSQTETFRGNVAHYGRMAWVGETSRVVGYAIDQPGRPMWIVAPNTGAIGIGNLSVLDGGRNGVIYIGGGSGLAEIDLAGDQVRVRTNSGLRIQNLISTRLAASLGPNDASGAIVALVVNGIASCLIPEAPINPATGLSTPLVALAQAGATIIKPDGSVVTSVNTGTVQNVTVTPDLVTFASSGNGTLSYAQRPYQLGASFAVSQLSGAGNQWSAFAQNGLRGANRHTYARRSGTRLGLMRFNESNAPASLFAEITDTSNTGWMAGDIRRCYLSDVSVGVVNGTNLVSNSTFADTSGWTPFNGNTTISAVAGALRLTIAAGAAGDADTSIATVVGQTYTVQFTLVGTGGSITYGKLLAGPAAGGGVNGVSSSTVTPGATIALTFTATAATTFLTLECGGTVNSTCDFTSVIAVMSIPDRSYKASHLVPHGTLTRSQVGVGSQLVAYSGFSAANYLQEAAYSADLDFASGFMVAPACSIPGNVAAAGWIADRSAATGPYWRIGNDATGKLVGEVYDGTTTRTVTSAASYAGVGVILPALTLSPSGSLALWVGGVQVAQVTGNPMGTLANANAVLTVGQRFALDAPFPGSITITDIGATVPSPDAMRWMYEQEKEMFRDGAQVTLPDSGAVVDLDYDPAQDKWKVVSAANESSFVGLVQISQAPVPAGSFTHVAHKSGIKLLSRSTTNPGVDITIPAKNALEEFNRRAEDARALARLAEPFDFVGGFTATTTTGSALLTSVASLSIPAAATVRGAQVSGTGIPVGTTILDIQGTTIQLSAGCTASASGVAVSFTDFILPVGYEAKQASAARQLQQEGATKDWTRRYDGFREAIRFGAAPGNAAWVQLYARRIQA